jgi:DNA-binding MarR family transcriptional regulator
MTDPLANFPGYSLRRAANAAMAELGARLARHDMRQVDASVLILIGQEPGITASAIGRILDIQRANMVPLLKRLDDAGLIARTPIDGKSQGLKLTGEGESRLTEVMREIERFESELLLRVPEAHRDHLLPALNALWR